MLKTKKIDRPIYMQQLIDSKDNGLIKIVTGLRRVGKSYLLKTLFKDYLLKEKVSKDHILRLGVRTDER